MQFIIVSFYVNDKSVFLNTSCILFVRISGMNHGVLIIETFLLALLARYAYRRPEPDIQELDNVIHAENKAIDSVCIRVNSEYNGSSHKSMKYECTHKDGEKAPDLGIVGKYTATDNAGFTNSL